MGALYTALHARGIEPKLRHRYADRSSRIRGYPAPAIEIPRPLMGYGFTLLMYEKSPVNNLVATALTMATRSAGLDQPLFARYE